MRSIARTLTTVGVIAAVIAIGVFVGWYASRPPAAPPLPSARPDVSPTVATVARGQTNGPVTGRAPSPAPVSPNDEIIPISMSDRGPITNWEDRVDEILRNNSDMSEKAKQLLALFPRMTVEGQVETAHHISNLLDDKDYPAFAQYLTNSATADDVLDVLMSDVMNRPNSMKMPTLLAVASNPDHPKAEEARQTLQLYLEDDYSTNLDILRENVEKWLKANPD